MPDPVVIAVAQPPCVALDVVANAHAHADAVRSAAARVVVFPEMSLTGYELQAPLLDPHDPRLAPLVRACADTGSIALAGAPVTGPCVGMLAVDGSGARVVYRKQYPGGDEVTRFRPGPEPGVLDVDGLRLGLAICRDTGISRHAADTAERGIDAYVGGVAHHAHEDAVLEERARRIATTYGVWVAFASFAGATGGGYTRTAGRSGIWGVDGCPVARAGIEVGAVVRAVIG